MIWKKEQKGGLDPEVPRKKRRLLNFLCHKALLACQCAWMLAASENFTGTPSPLNGLIYWKEEFAQQSFRRMVGPRPTISIRVIFGIFLRGMDMLYNVWEISRVTFSSD